MGKIHFEGFECDVAWLMQLRLGLTRLYNHNKGTYEYFQRNIKYPRGIENMPQKDRDMFIEFGVFVDGCLPLQSWVAINLMDIYKGDVGTPDELLSWLPPGERPPCDHFFWNFIGILKCKDDSSVPAAYCSSCGDIKWFSWSEWSTLGPDQIIGVPQ